MTPRTLLLAIVAGALLLTWRAGVPGLLVYAACVVCALALAETERNTDTDD